MMVKVGITSSPGTISSIKVITPAAFPTFPLYIRVINHPANGAQMTSNISPNPGMSNEDIPIPSKSNPKTKLRVRLSDVLDMSEK